MSQPKIQTANPLSTQETVEGNVMVETKPIKTFSNAQDIPGVLEILQTMANKGEKIIRPQAGEISRKEYDPSEMARAIKLLQQIIKDFIKEGRSTDEISENLRANLVLGGITNEMQLRDKVFEELMRIVNPKKVLLPHQEKQFEKTARLDLPIGGMIKIINDLERRKVQLEQENAALQSAGQPLRERNESLAREIEEKQKIIEEKDRQIKEREEKSLAHHQRMEKKLDELFAQIERFGEAAKK